MAPAAPQPVLVETHSDAARAAELFSDYPKILSWLVLHLAGMPALAGLVIARWDTATISHLERFAARVGSRGLLLRSDTLSETGRAPRGGYLVEPWNAEDAVRPLLEEGRIVFMLEPASPFDDMYSLGLEPAPDWKTWGIEVVGPGFDASDLKRGDVTPQERLDVRLDEETLVVCGRRLAAAAVQEAVRDIRFAKVAALLKCPVEQVERELAARSETMLLDFPQYPPLPHQLLGIALRQASRLRGELIRQELGEWPISISMSFLGRHRRAVFWDVVWPQSKYIVGDV